MTHNFLCHYFTGEQNFQGTKAYGMPSARKLQSLQ